MAAILYRTWQTFVGLCPPASTIWYYWQLNNDALYQRLQFPWVVTGGAQEEVMINNTQ